MRYTTPWGSLQHPPANQRAEQSQVDTKEEYEDTLLTEKPEYTTSRIIAIAACFQQEVFLQPFATSCIYRTVWRVLGKHSAHLTVQTIERTSSPPSPLPFYFVPTSIQPQPSVRKIHFFQFHVAVFLCPKELGLRACLTGLNSNIYIYFNEDGTFLLAEDLWLHFSLNSL